MSYKYALAAIAAVSIGCTTSVEADRNAEGKLAQSLQQASSVDPRLLGNVLASGARCGSTVKGEIPVGKGLFPINTTVERIATADAYGWQQAPATQSGFYLLTWSSGYRSGPVADTSPIENLVVKFDEQRSVVSYSFDQVDACTGYRFPQFMLYWNRETHDPLIRTYAIQDRKIKLVPRDGVTLNWGDLHATFDGRAINAAMTPNAGLLEWTAPPNVSHVDSGRFFFTFGANGNGARETQAFEQSLDFGYPYSLELRKGWFEQGEDGNYRSCNGSLPCVERWYVSFLANASLSEAILHYRVSSTALAGAWQNVPMRAASPGDFQFVLPQPDPQPGNVVEFWTTFKYDGTWYDGSADQCTISASLSRLCEPKQ